MWLFLHWEVFLRHDYFKDHLKIGNLTIISVFTACDHDQLCIFADLLKKICFSISPTGFWALRVNRKHRPLCC